MGEMNVRKLSEKMIYIVHVNEGVTLCDMMDRHEALGLLVPGVACPCDSLPGDDDDHLFILAYFEVLRHHVIRKQINCFSDDVNEYRTWEKWARGEFAARRFCRRDGTLTSSFEELLPKKFRVVAEMPLGLSEKTWQRLKARELHKVDHLDQVKTMVPPINTRART